MKFFSLFFLAFFATSGVVEVKAQGPIESIILAIIEQLKADLPAIIPIDGIPPIELISLLYDIRLNLTEVQLTGPAGFNVSRIEVRDFIIVSGTAELDIDFLEPLIIEGQYSLAGSLALIFPLYGKGKFSIQIHQLKIGAVTTLVIIPLPPQARNLDYTLFDGYNLITTFEGLLGGGDFADVIGEIVADIGERLVKILEPLLHEQLRAAIEALINALLSGTRNSELQPKLKELLMNMEKQDIKLIA